jgi:hypothetical protein
MVRRPAWTLAEERRGGLVAAGREEQVEVALREVGEGLVGRRRYSRGHDTVVSGGALGHKIAIRGETAAMRQIMRGAAFRVLRRVVVTRVSCRVHAPRAELLDAGLELAAVQSQGDEVTVCEGGGVGEGAAVGVGGDGVAAGEHT